jgi:type I restriction enzyme S subunit
VGLHAFISKNEEGWLCGTGCLIVRADTQQIAPLFLSYYLESASAQEYLKGHAVGSIMPNINTTILSAVPVPRASREEQLEIARALDAIDQALIAHCSLRTHRAILFEQMLHLLMTGELRVLPRKDVT